jgi:alkanesulfonate monooxygenase SsuD/methylene tetrahydromethanopterin reductase-like flavin-dependent oxidoreductase (luciferase family)
VREERAVPRRSVFTAFSGIPAGHLRKRVIFGIARGYHTREVESFGAPLVDQAANREMIEEGVDILFKALNGKPFSHKGKFYTIAPEVPYRGYKALAAVPALPHSERTFTSAPRISLVLQTSSGGPPSESAD